jgi:hypothetical protein
MNSQNVDWQSGKQKTDRATVTSSVSVKLILRKKKSRLLVA